MKRTALGREIAMLVNELKAATSCRAIRMKKQFGMVSGRRYMSWLLSVGLFLSATTSILPQSGWDQVPVILSQIVLPVFPDRDFLITHYGAVDDGKTDCTESFKKAIDACHESGGGRVVVPKGVYLTGAIHLKSHVNLHLEKDATILFSQNPKDYLPVVYTRVEGVECFNYSPFIYAFEAENIAITGEGTIDGQACNDAWWPWTRDRRYGWQEDLPNDDLDIKRLYEMPEKEVPVSQRIFGEAHYLRPNFIQPYKCKNILIDGITVKRSPMWEIHPVLCENVTVRNVTVISHGPNNDGCNPESSKNVLIKNCLFNTGDDCIAIKSGRNSDGRRIATASENIIIQDCAMRDGHGGVVIGSEMSGNCRNVFAENCTMDSPHLDRALRIKTNSLRGGIVENIYFRNITVGEVRDAVIRIYFHYGEGDVGQYPPVVRRIFVDHLTSQKSRYALMLDGYERSPISDISLSMCTFNGVAEGNILNHVSNLQAEDVAINSVLQDAEKMIRESQVQDE